MTNRLKSFAIPMRLTRNWAGKRFRNEALGHIGTIDVDIF